MPLKTAADMTRSPWPRTGDGAAAIACRAETRARMFDQCPLDLSGSARSPPGSQGRQGRLHRSPPAGTCCQPLRQMVSRMRWMRSASILPSLQKRRRSSSRLRALGFPVRLHADQRSDLGGATLGARFSALSADHLGYANDAGRGCYGPLPALPLCSCRGLSISFASGDFRQSMRSVFTACRSRSRLIAIPGPRR